MAYCYYLHVSKNNLRQYMSRYKFENKWIFASFSHFHLSLNIANRNA